MICCCQVSIMTESDKDKVFGPPSQILGACRIFSLCSTHHRRSVSIHRHGEQPKRHKRGNKLRRDFRQCQCIGSVHSEGAAGGLEEQDSSSGSRKGFGPHVKVLAGCGKRSRVVFGECGERRGGVAPAQVACHGDRQLQVWQRLSREGVSERRKKICVVVRGGPAPDSIQDYRRGFYF